MSSIRGVMDLYKAAEYAHNNFYTLGKKLPVKSKTKVKNNMKKHFTRRCFLISGILAQFLLLLYINKQFMKNLLLTGLFGSYGSCFRSIANQAQSARNDNYSLKGTWQITNVDYDKNYKIKPFDEGVDINCFCW